MKQYLRIILAAVVLLGAAPAVAQALESRISTATSGAEHQLFSVNPAVAATNKLKLGYVQTVINTDYEVTHVNTTTGDVRIDGEGEEIHHGVGFLVPLGGAAFGFTGQLRNKDMTTKTTDSTTEDLETYRNREGAVRLALDLMPALRMAFSYRIIKLENDLLGSHFVSNSDRTNYVGSMSGYSVGLFYENQNSGFGASYSPPVRGKAKIEGEQKIITEAGLISVEAFTVNANIKYGVAAKRWVYQSDDRATPSTSPVDLRQISLNGLDLEQFYRPKEQVMLGVDYPLAQSFSLGFNIYRTNAVFLYAFDHIPGDDLSRERGLHSYGAKLAAGYANNEIDVRLGVDYSQRKRTAIVDDAGWFGYANYQDYKATDQAIFAAINLTR